MSGSWGWTNRNLTLLGTRGRLRYTPYNALWTGSTHAADSPCALRDSPRDAGVAPSSSAPREGADVGLDEGTAVSSAYSIAFKFTGKIHKVTIEVKPIATADAGNIEKARRETEMQMSGSN